MGAALGTLLLSCGTHKGGIRGLVYDEMLATSAHVGIAVMPRTMFVIIISINA